MSVESEARSGRPSTSRNEEVIKKVRQIVMEDRHLTFRKIVEVIPKLLTEQQKELRVEISLDMLDCANNDLEFTKTIITGDETWVYGYDSESKFQSSQ